jgi:hypothetical protein
MMRCSIVRRHSREYCSVIHLVWFALACSAHRLIAQMARDTAAAVTTFPDLMGGGLTVIITQDSHPRLPATITIANGAMEVSGENAPSGP